MRRLLFMLSVCISCNQEEIQKPHSMIHVKFSDVLLEDDFNCIENRTIVGTFLINTY